MYSELTAEVSDKFACFGRDVFVLQCLKPGYAGWEATGPPSFWFSVEGRALRFFCVAIVSRQCVVGTVQRIVCAEAIGRDLAVWQVFEAATALLASREGTLSTRSRRSSTRSTHRSAHSVNHTASTAQSTCTHRFEAIYDRLNFSLRNCFTCALPPLPTFSPKPMTFRPSRLRALLNATYSCPSSKLRPRSTITLLSVMP